MAKKRRKNTQHSHDVNFRMNMPFFDQRPGILAGTLLTLFFMFGVLVWIYMFSMESGSINRILVVELIVNFILLAVNIYAICRIGYDGFAKNLMVTWLFNIILTTIGFFIGQVHLLAVPTVNQNIMLYIFLEFIVFVLLSALMAIVPTLIICLLMWLIMAIFGN